MTTKVNEPAAFTVNEFAARNHLSRELLYKLWRQGRGPRYMQIGAMRRITAEAERDWHRAMEAQTAGAAA